MQLVFVPRHLHLHQLLAIVDTFTDCNENQNAKRLLELEALRTAKLYTPLPVASNKYASCLIVLAAFMMEIAILISRLHHILNNRRGFSD